MQLGFLFTRPMVALLMLVLLLGGFFYQWVFLDKYNKSKWWSLLISHLFNIWQHIMSMFCYVVKRQVSRYLHPPYNHRFTMYMYIIYYIHHQLYKFKYIYMICPNLNPRLHGGILMLLPPNYKTFCLQNMCNISFYLFNYKIIRKSPS